MVPYISRVWSLFLDSETTLLEIPKGVLSCVDFTCHESIADCGMLGVSHELCQAPVLMEIAIGGIARILFIGIHLSLSLAID